MNQVGMIVLPTNDRLTFDPAASEEILGSFVELPIPMPRTATAWTDPKTGRPVVLWCDGARIKPADFATVLVGIEQYNDDLQRQGVVPEPPEVLTADLADELGNDDED